MYSPKTNIKTVEQKLVGGFNHPEKYESQWER
jgi:hypothetical protein